MVIQYIILQYLGIFLYYLGASAKSYIFFYKIVFVLKMLNFRCVWNDPKPAENMPLCQLKFTNSNIVE